ncbi:MAG: hypothetical protein GYA24_14570, partial [Candidatus Lokiarchaeota archaeon]|nr:hypothetical protein [Candidatus Lokiarchaeota archaeon]
DMAQPYVKFDKVVTPANHSKVQIGNQITLKWQVNGSITCDETRVQWGTNPDPRNTYSFTTPTDTTYKGKWIGGTGWSGSLNGATTAGKWFTQTITLPTTPGNYYFVARAKVDQTYGTSMGNLTGETYTENTYLRMLKERAKPGWTETITGTDGLETMSYQDYWYSDVIHVQVIADPVINITSPVTGADVYGTSFPVWVNASDLDNTITAVEVQVNGGTWTSATLQSGTMWRAFVNFNGYTEGSTVNVTARCINNDSPAVTKYASRLVIVNNYLRPNVYVTGLTNGTTRTAGSTLPASWIVNGSRVFNVDKTQLYWTNGTRMLWPSRPLDSYGGSPVTFSTAGSQGYFYSTSNTFGAGSGDDGWDWARNLGYVATSTGVMTTFRDPDGDSGATTHSQHPHSIEVEIGGLTTNTIDSGAFGMQFYVDAGLGLRSVTISFKWWAHDRIGILGLTDETEKPMYVKARFGSSSGGMSYLQGTGAQGGDAAADIIYFTSPNNGGPLSYSGTENINVTTLVAGSGWYYLELGAVFDARGTGQTSGEGICAFFDDIDITVTRYKIVTDPFAAGHVNRWNSAIKSGPAPLTSSDTITLPNMPGQTIYLAANASADGQADEGRSLVWCINLIAGGVSISNMAVSPSTGGTGTTFTIRANVASANPISSVLAFLEAPDESPIITIVLASLGNGTYSGTWNSAGQTRRTYYVDFFANNTMGESQGINNGATFVIVNTPPSITGASISPGTAYETTTLAASASGWSDADGDAPQYMYRWFRNGAV